MAKARTLYLVFQDISAGFGGVFAGLGADGEPVLAFDSQERAAAEARRLEEEARRTFPPFYAGDPARWSRLGLKRLMSRLQRLGLRRLPKPDLVPWEVLPAWRAWWDRHGGDLTPEQVAEVWKLLDQVQLYRVVEVPLRG